MMSNDISPIPPIGALIFLNDTQWAIAAKVPTSILNAARCELSEFLQTDGSRVVAGDKGMSVLLVFGGSSGEGEDLAIELSLKHKISVYLLDFNEYACSIMQFDGARAKRKKGHPAEFLDTYRVVAPGYEPGLLPPSPIISIGVVDDVTPDQARKAMPKVKDQFIENSRGVLVTNFFTTFKLSKRFKRRSFTLFYNREDKSFSCVHWIPDQQIEECFSVGKKSVNYKAIDSILGETTLDGILRVLDIPRHLLVPDRGALEASGGRHEDPR